MKLDNSNNVLIVNDVQDTQIPGGDYLQDYEPMAKLEEQIDFAKANGDWIFAVKINKPECGPIHPRILKRLAGYARFRIVEKPDEYNGAKWIVKMCIAERIFKPKFLIGGFQTHKCVQSTVRGLKVILSDCCITVIKDACDDQNGNRWRTFPELPGVVLLNSLESIERRTAARQKKAA